MKSSLIFVVLLLSVVESIDIDCKFANTFDNLYTCVNLNLKIDKNDMKIKRAVGAHLQGMQDSSVISVLFLSSGMKKIPRGIFQVFKNLRKFVIQGLDTMDEFLDNGALVKGDFHGGKSLTAVLIMTVVLDQLRARVFEGAENIEKLTLEACRIHKIHKEAFRGLKKLQSLGMKYNYITVLDPGTFSDLFELKHLLLSGNYLKSITRTHFKNLKKLVRISLIGNMLTEVTPDLVDGMIMLENLYMDQNVCIDEHFGSDGLHMGKFHKLIRGCSKEASTEMAVKLQADEIKHLESEVTTLQRLVEKYKKGNCEGPLNIVPELADFVWLRRNEMT